MQLSFEQLASIGKTNLDATLKFASGTAQLTERLVKSQMDATTEMLNSNNEQLQMMGGKPGSAASFAYWQSVYQTNAEKALEITRRYFSEVSRIQSEMAHLAGEQVAVMNKNAVKNFGDFAKAAAEETEKAVEATEVCSKAKRSA